MLMDCPKYREVWRLDYKEITRISTTVRHLAWQSKGSNSDDHSLADFGWYQRPNNKKTWSNKNKCAIQEVVRISLSTAPSLWRSTKLCNHFQQVFLSQNHEAWKHNQNDAFRDKIHQNPTGKMLYAQISTPYSIEFSIASAVPSLLREDLYIWIRTFCSPKGAVYFYRCGVPAGHIPYTQDPSFAISLPLLQIFVFVGFYPFEKILYCHVSINLHTQKQ